jgi:hypothetical protein
VWGESLGTSSADAIDEEFVAEVLKAPWQVRLARHIASLKLMNGTAATALEMVMMGLPGDLVTSRTAGHLNDGEPFILDQAGDVPIHSCNAQRIRSFLSKSESLVWRERAIRFEEGRAESLLLPRISSLDLLKHSEYLDLIIIYSR